MSYSNSFQKTKVNPVCFFRVVTTWNKMLLGRDSIIINAFPTSYNMERSSWESFLFWVDFGS